MWSAPKLEDGGGTENDARDEEPESGDLRRHRESAEGAGAREAE